MSALEPLLQDLRLQVDEALARYLPIPPDTPAPVSEAMRYSLMAGGKRLRPLLALAAAEAVASRTGRDPQAARALALPAACALEMIHTYSLIHDDLPAMDDDTLRRGRPTLHVVVGDGMAILAGDGLQAEAFLLLAREPRTTDPELVRRKLLVIDVIAEAAGPRGMVGGQAIDLEAGRPARGRAPATLTPEALQAMHARKTGALIRGAVLAGAIISGADETMTAAMGEYGAEVGLAFQIVDDVLDVEGTAADLGKTAGKDAAAGKPTYPALYGLAESRDLAARCLARADRALASVGMERSPLADLARLVVSRRS